MRPLTTLSIAAIIASGCSEADCDGPDLIRKADGNCYALDEGETVPDDSRWLRDGAVAAGIQDRFRRNRGTAAADFNGDGFVDFYLANPNDPATLFLNDGTGAFVEEESAPTTGNDAAVAAADYDNDGDPDLWVACGGWGDACPDALYRNDGVDEATGRLVLTEVSEAAGLSAEARQGFGVAWGDYDGDGWLDVFVSNKRDWSSATASPHNQLYRNNGDGTFTEDAEAAGVAGAGDSHTASWLDVEPDGDLDLFVPNLFGKNTLYLNQGDGRFSEAGPSDLDEPYQSFGSAAADVNNDGLVDLVVSANSGSEWAPEDRGDEPMVFLNTGGGDFVGMGLAELLGADMPVQMRVMGFAIGDLNMDGVTDFFFGNGEPYLGGVNRLLVSQETDDGHLEYRDETALIDTEAPQDGGSEPYRPYPYRTHGSVIVDVEGDFDHDLFVGNGGMNLIPDKEEPNRLFLSDRSTVSNAIALSLEGRRSNRDGVGALITVQGADGERAPVTRWVARSSGFNSSLPREQLIGLGTREAPYSVEVSWPSGIVQTLSIDRSRTRTAVVEPD